MSERLLGSLRSLLTHKPSAYLFAMICASIDRSGDPEAQEVGLDYAAGHLASWPDHLRAAEVKEAWPSFPKGVPGPSFALVRWLSCEYSVQSGAVDDMLALPQMNQITGLTFSHINWSVVEIQAFVNSDALYSLRALSVEEPAEHDCWFRLLSLSPLLGQLKELGLNGCHIEYVSLAALFDSDQLENLESLSLDKCYLGDEGIAIVGQEVALSQLKVLSLKGNFITPVGLEGLMSSPHLTSLSSLDVSDNKLREEGACALADSSLLGQMKVLDLSHCQIGTAGMKALAESPEVEMLEALHMGGNQLGNGAIKELAGSPYLGLKSLRLPSNDLTSWDVGHLAASPCLERLEVLDLGHNPLGTGGAISLRRSSYLSSLRELNLSHCELMDNGIRILSTAPTMSHVETLDLRGNKLTDKGIIAFFQSDVWSSLSALRLSNNQIREVGVNALVGSPLLAQLTSLAFGYLPDGAGALLAASPQIAGLHSLEWHPRGQSEASKRALGMSPHLHPVLREQVLESLSEETLRAIASAYGIATMEKESLVQVLAWMEQG